MPGITRRWIAVIDLCISVYAAVSFLGLAITLSCNVLNVPKPDNIVVTNPTLLHASLLSNMNNSSLSQTSKDALSTMLSFPSFVIYYDLHQSTLKTNSFWDAVMHDGILMACFCLAHSIFAHRYLKTSFGFHHRPLYVLISAVSAQIVWSRWITGPVVYELSQYMGEKTLHIARTCALITCASVILYDDLLDLFWIRQCFSALLNRNPIRKTSTHEALDRNIRHRPFLSVLALLLLHSTVTVDKLFLAAAFIVYSGMVFTVSSLSVLGSSSALKICAQNGGVKILEQFCSEITWIGGMWK
eukprot:gene8596-1015_t